MKQNINNQMTLGEIATRYPFTVAVLNRYKLDYCCGGRDTLEKASREAGLDTDTILAGLEDAAAEAAGKDTQTRDWSGETLSGLIDHILNTHHVFMRDALSELNLLLFKVLKAHFSTDGPLLLEVHRLFGSLKCELEAHLVKEEERLFPMILRYEETGEAALKEEIRVFQEETEHEHDGAGDVFKTLAALTGDYSAPGHACASYRRAFRLLDELEKDTFNHIHLENTVLFGKLAEI